MVLWYVCIIGSPLPTTSPTHAPWRGCRGGLHTGVHGSLIGLVDTQPKCLSALAIFRVS